jgi:peptide/nickel transport system substrate-binding protein
LGIGLFGPGSSGEARAQSREDTLVVVTEYGPNSLDIQGLGANQPTHGPSWNIYDRLLTYDTKTLPDGTLSYDYTKVSPELAESWNIAADGMSVTFRLRSDAIFHDGTPVTANDVKWSLDRAVGIGGFSTIQMAAGSLQKPEQFEVLDDKTLRVSFLRKDKLTLPDLAVNIPVIMNSKLARAHATEQDPWAQDWLTRNEAGGGAFRVESWEPGQQLVLSRFNDWKSGKLPAVAKVIVREIPAAGTRRSLLQRGDADVSYGLPPKDFAELAKSGKIKVVGVPVENALVYLDMNVKIPPFDNLLVRRAIAYAIPYDDIMKGGIYDRGLPMFGATSATVTKPIWPQPSPYRTDLDKARSLLAEAGLKDGFSTPLSFDLGQATIREPSAILIQESLAKIGVRLTLNKIPPANWMTAMDKKNMPLTLTSFQAWLNYPEYFFFWTYHGQNTVFNTMNYQNPKVDALIDKARFAMDNDEYESAVKAFIQIAYDEVPRIPLFQYSLDVAMQPSIKGYKYWFHTQMDYRCLSKM